MKTNVNVVRKLDVFEIIQRTKDGMFDGNDLLYQWNKAGISDLRINKFLEQEKVKKFISALKEDLNLNGANQTIGDNQMINIVRGRRNKQGLKEKDQVWMHPLLFIKFAMWLNPAFEVKVLKFVYDELIKDRHLAGDNYRMLSVSISKFKDVNYPEIAKALNWIVFNKHYTDIRNQATPEQMRELHELEQKLAYAVDMGLINSYDRLLQVMRDTYNKKYQKF